MQKSESAPDQTWMSMPQPRHREKAASADATLAKGDTLWSDTDQALHDILHTKLDGHQYNRSSDPGKADDLHRLSVDELLALRIPSPTSTMSISEKTDSDDPEASSEEGRELRAWLEGIDASRASEFVAYARSFEQQGFLTLGDLAQLDENDVEQAMSEIGISKFAHRARIRKAILRLPLDGAVPESHFVQPALAG
jgi:hypothetical protein